MSPFFKTIILSLMLISASAFSKDWTASEILTQVKKEYPNARVGENVNILSRVTESRKTWKKSRLVVLTDHNDDPTHILAFDFSHGRIDLIDDSDQPKLGNKIFFPAQQLTEGVTVIRESGRDIIELTSDFAISRDEVTPITMRYLYRGNIFGGGKYKEIQFSLSRTTKGWEIISGNKKIDQIHMVVNKKLGIVLGIKEVQLR